VLVASYELVYGQRILLGVYILDLDVGGLRQAEARDLLSANLGVYLRSPLTIRWGSREWKLSPAELGASYDVEQTVAQALAVGREGGFLQRLQRQSATLRHPAEVGLAFVLNEAALKGSLERLAREVETQPQDARLTLAGVEVAISPSRVGYRIDREAFEARLREAFSSLSAAPIELPVQTVSPQVKEQDLAQARKRVEQMLAGPILVSYGDRRWFLTKEALVQMLTIRQSKDAQGRPVVRVRVIPEKAQDYAKGLAREIDRPAQDARLAWNKGHLIPIVPSRPGLAVDVEGFPNVLQKALDQGKREMKLTVLVKKPAVAVEDIPNMGIREKLVEKSTSFAGTYPDRIHNIRLGARRINGKVIPPGGVYSMAQTLGEISERTGYKLGFAIVGPNTVLDVGGGLSQLTTTVFKAAFWAGLPIIERTTHAYRIMRYEPVAGIEATIYPPAVDMKFRNDTGHFLLLEARTDEKRVYIALYGTNPNGRQVSIEGPYLTNVVPTDRKVIRRESPILPKGQEIWVESAVDGVDVTVIRIIKERGKEVRRETFFNRFRPAHNVLLVGTREERQGGQRSP
jgi:vancomycin resistance protein YoaR